MDPHVASRKTHQRLQEILFVTPKRLLQQYLPKADITTFAPDACFAPEIDQRRWRKLCPLVLGRASLRPSQVPAQDSAERPLPKRGRQAWEVEEELEEELEGVLFVTPGPPAHEDLDVGCWKSSTV